MPDRFDKFTERARKVLQLAQEEAQRFNHNYIGTEHLLLGLVREGEGVAAKVLANLGVELSVVRDRVTFIIGRGDRAVTGEIGLTPRAKKVIELSVDEARRLNHHYIGTEHLLLGLVREGEGIAAGVLESLGVSLDNVRAEVLRVLEQRAGAPPRSPLLGRLFGGRPAGRAVQYQGDARRFDEAAQRVLQLASEEAAAAGEPPVVGTDHLLIALLDDPADVPSQALAEAGLDLERARQLLRAVAGSVERAAAATPGFGTQASRAIESAVAEARRRDQDVAPAHLLLGVLALERGIGGRLIEALGVSRELARAAVERRLGEPG